MILDLVEPPVQEMSYADVVKFCPVIQTLKMSCKKTSRYKNRMKSLPTPPVRRKAIRKANIPTKKSCSRNTVQVYRQRTSEVIVDVGDNIAIILPTSAIHGIYKGEKSVLCTKSKSKQKAKKKQVKSTATFVHKCFKCPLCPVTCSREEYLLDHFICQHVAVRGSVVVNNRRFQGEHNNQHAAVTKSFNIAFLVKKLIGVCWRNFRRLRLMLSGDVEENQGPVMINCQWESCRKEIFETIQQLGQHLISHVHPGILCKWNDCVFSCQDDKQLESHVLQHVYLEQFSFTSLDEWEKALPLGNLSELSTDLRLCLPSLRSKLNLPLMDEDFKIPHQYPYTVESHQHYLNVKQTSNSEEFDKEVSDFIKKRSVLDEHWTCKEDACMTSDTYQTKCNLDNFNLPRSVYCCDNVPPTNAAQIITNRPELISN